MIVDERQSRFGVVPFVPFVGLADYGDYGEVYVTPTEAANAIRQTDQYMKTLDNDFLAWSRVVLARGGVTAQENSLLNGWMAFRSAWASFLAEVSDLLSGFLSAAQAALNAREWRDQANSYLTQAGGWRDSLAATGYSPNAGRNPKPAGGGGLFNWPSLADVPWYVWALGVAGVAVYLDLPRKLGLLKPRGGG